uniref:Uncharacterized protein n=1 Tax=Arundo donax TaxID=35708 RepID=A0A0A9AYT8_ARUDO
MLAPTMAIWEVVFKVRFRSSGSRGPSSSYRSSASDDASGPAPRHGAPPPPPPSVLSMS